MSEMTRVHHGDEILELPCPQCGDPQRDEAYHVHPGKVYTCLTCECFLVVTAVLTLARATNDDLCRLPIGEHEVTKAMQRLWQGIPQDVYC